MRIRMLAVLFLLVISVASSFASEKQYFRYIEFIQAIKAGSVKTVTISEYSRITGVYIEDGVEKEFQSWHSGPANDPLLLDILEENDVEVTIAETEKSDLLPDWFFYFTYAFEFVIPVILLVLVVILLRKVNKLTAKPEDITPFS